jgi:hypothetical protein
MKKAILILLAAGITYVSPAQDKYVVSALTALKSNNLEEAKQDIDKAMANPESKEKPKALLAKAQIYFALQSNAKYEKSDPYKEAFSALFKLAETKPDYEKATVDQLLLFSAFTLYNEGVKAYNDKSNPKKYEEVPEAMEYVTKIRELNGGKRFDNFSKIKEFDTVTADAYLTMANCYYYSSKYDQAIPLLIKAKNNPITRSAPVYQCLVDAYNKQGKTTEAFAAIEDGLKTYPNDVVLKHLELNYYIKAGKQDELLKKLEETAAKEPENADVQFNIATTYLGMVNPKDGKKPANAAELYGKAESAFQAALKTAPDNGGFNYNFGALYYTQAVDVNEQMNALGNTAADQKKYDELKAKRDGLFTKSTPYFEKAYSTYSANEANLKGDDKITYKQTLIALKEVYARQSKMDKSAEMQKKYDSLK